MEETGVTPFAPSTACKISFPNSDAMAAKLFGAHLCIQKEVDKVAADIAAVNALMAAFRDRAFADA